MILKYKFYEAESKHRIKLLFNRIYFLAGCGISKFYFFSIFNSAFSILYIINSITFAAASSMKCPGDETGRHAGLRSLWGKTCRSSNLLSGTF